MMQWTQVKAARRSEKAAMEQLAIDETQCSKELFHPVFEDDCPYEYKVAMHSGYQLDAYRADNGEIADSSYHLLIARCGACGELMTVSGADVEVCGECGTIYEE